MTRSLTKAGLVAAVIAFAAAAPLPASAGGFTLSLTPSGDSADLIRQGLQIYGIVNDLKGKNHARVNQKGSDNAAAVQQTGAGNYGLVYQRGRGHTATLSQAGVDNALGVFQFGRRANIDVTQAGAGEVGLVFQGGW
jgi:Curlin associated repeat